MNPLRLIAAPVLATTLLLTVGCETTPRSVPSDARVVTAGGDNLSYNVPTDGMVYVYQENSDKVIYSGKVEAGDVLNLDRERDRLTINNRPVAEPDLKGVDDYIIRFQPGTDTSKRTVILEETTVKQREVVR